jgi:hypothetical protein
MTDGARKHEMRAQMKDPFMINGDRYRTQRIKDHKANQQLSQHAQVQIAASCAFCKWCSQIKK